MKNWLLAIGWWWCVAARASPLPRCAQSAAPDAVAEDSFVTSAREALARCNRLPWYDAERDSLRSVPVAPSDAGEFANRQSRWSAKAPAPSTTQTTNSSLWTDVWLAFWMFLKVLFWVVVAALLAFLLYLLIAAYLRREEAELTVGARTTIRVNSAEEDAERIESLPFTVARPRGDLLDEALAMYNAGNFRQAVIYLYSYLLIQLDRHHRIRLSRGKTNRMYLGELRRQPRLREILEGTMVAFEDVFFGNHALSREAFEACWNQLDEFHQQVEQGAT
jgi:hypothetical protein